VVEGTETGGGGGLRDMPPHAGALTLADTTGDLELKLKRPPALGVDVVATDVGALEPEIHTGGGPNGDDGAGHVAGVVELPLLKLLTLLLQHINSTHQNMSGHICQHAHEIYILYLHNFICYKQIHCHTNNTMSPRDNYIL
jgi:hypothetical protein